MEEVIEQVPFRVGIVCRGKLDKDEVSSRSKVCTEKLLQQLIREHNIGLQVPRRSCTSKALRFTVWKLAKCTLALLMAVTIYAAFTITSSPVSVDFVSKKFISKSGLAVSAIWGAV